MGVVQGAAGRMGEFGAIKPCATLALIEAPVGCWCSLWWAKREKDVVQLGGSRVEEVQVVVFNSRT